MRHPSHRRRDGSHRGLVPVPEAGRPDPPDPFSLHPVGQDDRLVDIGSGGGFDAFVAGQLGLDHVEFREGIAEELPVDDVYAHAFFARRPA